MGLDEEFCGVKERRIGMLAREGRCGDAEVFFDICLRVRDIVCVSGQRAKGMTDLGGIRDEMSLHPQQRCHRTRCGSSIG